MNKTVTQQIPLLDLNPQYEGLENEILEKIRGIIQSKQFLFGPDIVALEKEIADYSTCKEGIAVSSGTDALLLVLMAMGIGAGDEVITTPFTFFATAGCIARTGATIVFADIDPDTFNIDPKEIEKKITPKTKAIMPVHLFGQMADMDAIMAIAKKHNLQVIEDAAQAIGAEYKGKKAGSIGHAGCFSFFPSKNLGAAGDAGMVVTNDSDLAQKMRILRDHGQNPRYTHHLIGGNFRMDSIQAAVLRIKFRGLVDQHKRRIQNGEYYNKTLANTPVKRPHVLEGCTSIYNQYTLQTDQRDALQEHLNKRTIGNAIYYPTPLHLQPCFAFMNHHEGDFPKAETAAQKVLSIPIYAELNPEQLAYVVDGIRSFFNA